MNESLKLETEKLKRSWMRHDASLLRDYLVANVEDPRLNQQSLLTRHCLIRALAGDRLENLMAEERCFAAALNWLSGYAAPRRAPEEYELALHALTHRADNAEGLEIPLFVQRAFDRLPLQLGEHVIPNYVRSFIAEVLSASPGTRDPIPSLDTFATLWRAVLTSRDSFANRPQRERRVSVVEPGCGSANDYRFLEAYGLAPLLDYTGFDLCPKNVANALALFPAVRFECGNVFEIAAPGRAFDWCIVHDLFEHLSLEGLEVAIEEVCRVTDHGLCIGFFNMDEIPAHKECPAEDYHWNILSMQQVRESFAAHGFAGRVVHIGSCLGQDFGWDQTHNPNAYTFELYREHGDARAGTRA